MPASSACASSRARLADAREDDVLGRHARRQRALQLAARDDVGAIALVGQHAQHREVGVGLDRIGEMDARATSFSPSRNTARVALEGRARIDIDGRADLVGDARQRHVLGVQHAVAIG